jgi:hypothetical protein
VSSTRRFFFRSSPRFVPPARVSVTMPPPPIPTPDRVARALQAEWREITVRVVSTGAVTTHIAYGATRPASDPGGAPTLVWSSTLSPDNSAITMASVARIVPEQTNTQRADGAPCL